MLMAQKKKMRLSPIKKKASELVMNNGMSFLRIEYAVQITELTMLTKTIGMLM